MAKKISMDHLRSRKGEKDLALAIISELKEMNARSSSESLKTSPLKYWDRMKADATGEAIAARLAFDQNVTRGIPREYHGGVGLGSSSGSTPGLKQYSR